MQQTKKKKRFDIKTFFIQHVEKMVLGVLVVVAMYVAYQGTLYEPLTWQPDDLKQLSASAKTTIEKSERSAADEGVKIIDYDTKATWIKVGVKPDLYQLKVTWLPSLFQERYKRGKVDVYSVRDLRATASVGAISINPTAAAEIAEVTGDRPANSGAAATSATPQEGRQWAVVTGLIPIQDQYTQFVSAFSLSVHPDPMRDMPAYFMYEIERAEVLPGQSEANFQWKKIDFVQKLSTDMKIWAGTGVDPVDPTFIAPIPANAIPMAFPLPPATRIFGEEVAHPPVIPMLSETQLQRMREQQDRDNKLRRDSLIFNESDILRGDPFGGGSAVNDEMRRRERQIQGDDDDEETGLVNVTDYLFRFIDFQVEMGKTYRYRVRLYLANPNHKLAEPYVDDIELTKERFLRTEYSTPSNAVTVPLSSRILVSDVNSPKTGEPSASIVAVYFDMVDGSEWTVDRERVFRGSTINMKTEVTATSPGIPAGPGGPGMGMSIPPAAGRQSPPRNPAPTGRPIAAPTGEKKSIEVISDVCIIDMQGGVALRNVGSGRVPQLRSPAKLLVLEPSGSLVIRKVDADKLEIETVKNPVPTNTFSGRGGYPDGI